ncbi:hypothetical protein OAC88_02830 [Flavobacteriaceae bacterium]|nr:hypothetical protein [Flavobacteriaceae bacterium]
MIEDLSWSKIVDLIQNDNTKGADMLEEIATEKEQIDKEFLDAEIKLQQIKTRQLHLKEGALLVLKHLKREAPLAVKRKDFIVVVSDADVTIERNVL